MKAIILSAGKGSRLWPLTKDNPKILIDLGDGSTVLSRQLNSLSNLSIIDGLILGGGYLVEKIEEAIKRHASMLPTKIVYNPFFDISGPLVTLWIVLNKIDLEKFIIMNGDTIFSHAVFDAIEADYSLHPDSIKLVVSRADQILDDDVKIEIEAGHICNVGKNMHSNQVAAISAGMLIVSGPESRKKFYECLDKVSRRPDFTDHGKTWHSFIVDLISDGIVVHPLFVDKQLWAEIDLHLDLEDISHLLQAKLKHQ